MCIIINKSGSFSTCSGSSVVSSSVWVLLSRLNLWRNRGVEKQKKPHRKHCISVRPQSEKHHTRPRASATDKRHRDMVLTLEPAACARLLAHIVVGSAEEDGVSVRHEAWRRKKVNFIQLVNAVIGCGEFSQCLLLVVTGRHLQVTPDSNGRRRGRGLFTCLWSVACWVRLISGGLHVVLRFLFSHLTQVPQ